jgi:hypothetical protein
MSFPFPYHTQTYSTIEGVKIHSVASPFVAVANTPPGHGTSSEKQPQCASPPSQSSYFSATQLAKIQSNSGLPISPSSE